MNYIVFDLELNSKPFKSTIPNEIIEIGAIKLDQHLNKIDSFQAFIKPKFFKKLFPVVKKKTSISQLEINSALDFKSVIKEFIQWLGKEYILISWGHDDIHHITLNSKYHRIKTSWLKKNIDMQKQYSTIFDLPLGQRSSLENALIMQNISIEEELHRAINDAHYTSLLFIKIFDKLDLTTFNSIQPKQKKKPPKPAEPL